MYKKIIVAAVFSMFAVYTTDKSSALNLSGGNLFLTEETGELEKPHNSVTAEKDEKHKKDYKKEKRHRKRKLKKRIHEVKDHESKEKFKKKRTHKDGKKRRKNQKKVKQEIAKQGPAVELE